MKPLNEFSYCYSTPIGKLKLTEKNNAITEISFSNATSFSTQDIIKQTSLIQKTILQLQEYFAGTRKSFDIPLSLEGTNFQQKVWNTLLTIPYGETRSYKQIAQLVRMSYWSSCRWTCQSQ